MHFCRLWSSCFLLFLVTTLPRHLVLAALPARSSEENHPSVVWSSPAAGDRFGPGDAIAGKWQVTDQSQRVVSPSFKLCASGEDAGCGATVWPEVVEESGDGGYYYHATLTAPNVTTESGYYLRMNDDFGHTYSSPIFTLTPTPQNKDKPASRPHDVVAQPRPDQAPMSSPSSSSAGTNSNGSAAHSSDHPDPAAAPSSAGGGGPAADTDGETLSLPPSAAGGAPSPNSTATWTPGSGSGPLVAAAHSAPPTAALAVPLSLAGAIVLLAGGLALHHRRRLAAEKERCAQQLVTSDVSSSRSVRSIGLALELGGGGGGGARGKDDVEKALFVRSLFRRGSSDLHNAYYERRHIDEAAAAAAAAAADSLYHYAPSYAYDTPVPRQRTRHLDLLTREFTTTQPRARLSSSSSSHHREHFGDRHRVRRGHGHANNANAAGGSSLLWRSLSIARRKAAAPPAASSLTASPAMTESVASVTSEVLPSYLPSPNFAGATDRGCRRGRGHGHDTSTGDFGGFENVPLSPPPPPPLHTREEAAEPDDARMRELRGVYEAVARALGGVRGV